VPEYDSGADCCHGPSSSCYGSILVRQPGRGSGAFLDEAISSHLDCRAARETMRHGKIRSWHPVSEMCGHYAGFGQAKLSN
jgi:hypothetical protein